MSKRQHLLAVVSFEAIEAGRDSRAFYCNALAMLLKALPTAFETGLMKAITTSAISTIIRTYSTIVCPDSLLRKRTH